MYYLTGCYLERFKEHRSEFIVTFDLLTKTTTMK